MKIENNSKNLNRKKKQKNKMVDNGFSLMGRSIQHK